jgi:hypothetical protein
MPALLTVYLYLDNLRFSRSVGGSYELDAVADFSTQFVCCQQSVSAHVRAACRTHGVRGYGGYEQTSSSRGLSVPPSSTRSTTQNAKLADVSLLFESILRNWQTMEIIDPTRLRRLVHPIYPIFGYMNTAPSSQSCTGGAITGVRMRGSLIKYHTRFEKR